MSSQLRVPPMLQLRGLFARFVEVVLSIAGHSGRNGCQADIRNFMGT